MHPYSNEPAPAHRGAGPQLHPKAQPSPYRGGASRRHQPESNPAEASATRVETRSQRGRVPPPASSSRIKSSARSMFEEIMSTTPDASTIPSGRGRPYRPTGPVPVRPTTFDPSTYPSFSGSVRPRGSAPMYVPSPFSQADSHPFASSAPAAASVLMSAGIPTHVIQHPSQLTLSSQDKSRLKEWIQTQARHFRATYFTENSSTSNIALEIIRRLAAAVDLLQVGKDHKENSKALSDIAHILAKGDVSPFEMVHSSLITKLFQYLTDDISLPNNRLERVKLFLHIFINVPDEEKDLKQFIVELRQTQLHQEKGAPNVLSHLISKLHGCINQLEQFPIRVNDSTTRSVPTSALRLISTHQLKCHLVRHPQCKTLKQWNSGPVKIDPFALVSALEKYLLLRGIASGGMVSDLSRNERVTLSPSLFAGRSIGNYRGRRQ